MISYYITQDHYRKSRKCQTHYTIKDVNAKATESSGNLTPFYIKGPTLTRAFI